MRLLINRTHTLAPERPVLVYTEFALSTEPGAPTLYNDSRWLDASGAQIACAPSRAQAVPVRRWRICGTGAGSGALVPVPSHTPRRGAGTGMKRVR